MSDIYVEDNFYQGTSSACLVDLTPPTFTGINFLDVESRGQIRAGWPAASDITLPIDYEVYIQASTATGLFNTANIIAITPNLTFDIFGLPDGSFLVNGTTYYVGVRALDGVRNRETNTTSLSVISTGILTSIDTYQSHGAFVVNDEKKLQGTLWADRNGNLAGGTNGVLGTASYQVYDSDGNAVAGLTQSGLTANGQGQYIITPVLSTLVDSLEHYVVKVSVSVDGEARVNYIPFIDATPEYKINGLFFVNDANEFDGTFWSNKNEVMQTSGLGTGSYQVYDHTGAPVVGMSASGITADGNGMYKLTAIASLLAQGYPGFSVKVTLTSDNVTRSTMIAVSSAKKVYLPKAQFSINSANQLQATLWLEHDGAVETTSLGSANYTIYDVNGNAVSGLTQTGITADVNGRFHITPVSATLLTDLTHYSAKVGIVANGIERIAYKGFTLLGT